MTKQPVYKPFSAFSAMEDAQLALVLATLHPAIDSVLLTGKTGTGKTAIVQALSQLLEDKKIIKLPLSITEETLAGTLDIEQTLSQGAWHYEQGILENLHNNILFIDNINLLSSTILNKILQIQERGWYELSSHERKKPCKFTLIATMNPDEGGIPTKVLDRFSLFVNCEKSNSKHFRIEILEQENIFQTKKEASFLSYQEEEQHWKEKLATATEILPKVKVKPTDIETIAQLCKEAFVAGHRGDLSLLWASIANAAFQGRKYITFEDIKRVKDLALIHRIRSPKQAENEEQPQQSKEQQQNEQTPNNKSANDNSIPEKSEVQNNQEPSPLNQTADNQNQTLNKDNEEEECFEIGNLQIKVDILQQKTPTFGKREGVGKRIKCRNTEGNGRHIRSVAMGENITKNIDFVATIRTAAPFQKLRAPKELAIDIRKQDLQKKIREHRIGNTILFLVDASGSMGIQQRMKEAKAGIFSLLKNAYVNRDTVGLMTFRKEEAELVLPPTRSIEKAYQLLEKLKTGGRTPLLHALKSALNLLTSLQLKNKENIPLMIFFTDGKATSSYKSENLIEEIKQVALQFQKYDIHSIVIDTECSFIRLGYAQQIANWLGAKYYHLDQWKEKTVKNIIEN